MAKKKRLYPKKLYDQIKTDLLNQLELNGVAGKHYENMIEDYMQFWHTKMLLQEDIKLRGVNVEYNNGGGQSGFKRNDSVTDLVKVNSQMLKILSELNLKPSKEGGKDDPKPTEDDYY
ncbi:MAG: P27 family phage terminase small subunit [Bacilli bacterium]|nr:P27 family phage terminase small subunit [Bacilli bacterium]MDD4794973.1 P27 family phage terminase small subunit [Bacilli bacterium]